MTDITEKKDILKDLINLHATLKTLEHDKSNPYYKSQYTTLDGIMNIVRPILSEYNFVIIHEISQTYDLNNVLRGEILTTKLMHISGHYYESSMVLRAKKEDDMQQYGSAISYARRYTTLSVLALTSSDDPSDDDGNFATDNVLWNQFLHPSQLEAILRIININPEDIKNDMPQLIEGYTPQSGMTTLKNIINAVSG